MLHNLDLLDRFTDAQKSLVIQTSDLSLKSISDMVDSNAIDLSPKYQRRERWDQEKKSELIESFIMNVPVPPIYLAEEQYGVYSVIDGKQRITAIHDFLSKGMVLKSLSKFVELNGRKFEDLPNEIVNALTIRPYLRIVTLLKQSDPDIKHEVFLRLNKAGVSLSPQEIRNVAFRGDLNDMLFDLSSNEFFSKQLKSDDKKGKNYTEMLDVQFVLRFFALRENWKSFSGNMDRTMDQFMIENRKASRVQIDFLKARFERAVNGCEKIWGENAFYRPSKNSYNYRALVLQGMYDCQMISVDMLTDSELASSIRKKDLIIKRFLKEIENNKQYEEAITQFTSNPENVRYRIEKTAELLRA